MKETQHNIKSASFAMPTADSLTVTAHLTLIQNLDRNLPAEDRRRLPDWLRDQLDADLPALEQSDALVSSSEMDRTEKSSLVATQLERMEQLVRDGYKGIGAIRTTVIGEVERAAVFASYGWTGGLLGRLTDDRVLALARIGCRKHEDIAPAFRYAPELVTDLNAALEIYDRSVPASRRPAAGSPAQKRNAKLKAATETLSQLRYWYCCTSRQTISSPDLLQAGFQPRRKPRTAKAVEAASKRQEERRVERERKRLERLEEKTQRSLNRLAQETERLRAQADETRSELTALGGGVARDEKTGTPGTGTGTGEISLSA